MNQKESLFFIVYLTLISGVQPCGMYAWFSVPNFLSYWCLVLLNLNEIWVIAMKLLCVDLNIVLRCREEI